MVDTLALLRWLNDYIMKKYQSKYFWFCISLVGLFSAVLLLCIFRYVQTPLVTEKEESYDFMDYPWNYGQALSMVDYRFFGCGKEYFIAPTPDSDVGQGIGLYKRSANGTIILDGLPVAIGEAIVPAFFEAVGGLLYAPADHIDVKVRIPTDVGVLEFNNDHTQCVGKPAKLRVFRHHLLDPNDLSSLKESISWKYPYHTFRNNYGTVPPGDCLVFVFDTEEELEKNWPVCTAYRK